MPRYPVKEPLNHDQKDYAPGSTVEMTEELATALIVLGVIGEATSESVSRLNASDTIAQIKMVQDVAELDKLAVDNQDRKSVLDAIDKRRKELAE